MAGEEYEDQSYKIDALARDVLRLSRNSLLVHLRFMDMALSRLEPEPSMDLTGDMATNGERFLYQPVNLLKKFKKERESVVRDYLHLVLHCVFSHPFISTLINRPCWDLACDIAVENAINELDIQAFSSSRSGKQVRIINSVREEVKYMTAEKIYRYFLDQHLDEFDINELRAPFIGDNHALWYLGKNQQQTGARKPADDDEDPEENREEQEDQENSAGENTQNESDKDNNEEDSENDDNEESGEEGRKGESGPGSGNAEKENAGASDTYMPDLFDLLADSYDVREFWKDIAERMETDLETFSRNQGANAGGLTQSLKAVNRERYDYERFLKQFAVLGEAVKTNDDEFDYIFYTYGLRLYKNMPLIEPLEYKDVKRIREFVIAIDTSGSVSGELVQKFIQKTYNILEQQENYFKKINIHIIQCDAKIREDKKITSKEEFDEYLDTMTLTGFGGTDFRPVFEYVDELIKNREFVNLKGLIYFTDGYGTFPEKMPAYNSAFVFVDDNYGIPEVPVWAIKLVLTSEELLEDSDGL